MRHGWPRASVARRCGCRHRRSSGGTCRHRCRRWPGRVAHSAHCGGGGIPVKGALGAVPRGCSSGRTCTHRRPLPLALPLLLARALLLPLLRAGGRGTQQRNGACASAAAGQGSARKWGWQDGRQGRGRDHPRGCGAPFGHGLLARGQGGHGGCHRCLIHRSGSRRIALRRDGPPYATHGARTRGASIQECAVLARPLRCGWRCIPRGENRNDCGCHGCCAPLRRRNCVSGLDGASIRRR
jgi:hypothetical protein